jgi:hypothetical protein
MIDIFAEHGMIGLVGVLFAAQMVFLHKTLMGKLIEIEDIVIKLIDRWNKSDDIRDRRYESLIKEMNQITDDLNFLKGRINGGTRG